MPHRSTDRTSGHAPAKPMSQAELTGQAAALRARIVRMIHRAPAGHPGHPGGSLSAADIITALYFGVLRVRPDEPDWPDRDRFVLSKGHAAPALYAALAARGYFAEDDLGTLRRPGCKLQGHPDMCKTPGVDMTTGSLGQGISAAVGMALGGKIDGRDYRVFTLLSDGELNEGQVWEAAMAAYKYKLDNLTAIVDANGLQNDGPIEEVMPMGDVVAKWQAFGWAAEEIDGHDVAGLVAALSRRPEPGRPRVFVARTVKGKGVSFMENQLAWHAGAINTEQLSAALAELGCPDTGAGQ